MQLRDNSKKINNTKKLTFLSLFLAVSLIIFTIEAGVPPLAPIPGIKLGLANTVTLFIMVQYNRKDAFTVLMLRIILSSIFAGQITGFMYSMFGGILSFAVMSVLLYLPLRNKMWVISAFGAVGHNVGQIIAAVIMLGTWNIVFYFPLLFVSGIITGIFTGLISQMLLKRFRKLVLV